MVSCALGVAANNCEPTGCWCSRCCWAPSLFRVANIEKPSQIVSPPLAAATLSLSHLIVRLMIVSLGRLLYFNLKTTFVAAQKKMKANRKFCSVGFAFTGRPQAKPFGVVCDFYGLRLDVVLLAPVHSEMRIRRLILGAKRHAKLRDAPEWSQERTLRTQRPADDGLLAHTVWSAPCCCALTWILCAARISHSRNSISTFDLIVPPVTLPHSHLAFDSLQQ